MELDSLALDRFSSVVHTVDVRSISERYRGLSSEGFVTFGEYSTTPFEVGSTRWFGFRR